MALTIGDFARLGGVSARMLRHYDQLGLLHPAYVDDTSGYRYYSAAQLTRLNRLIAFKDLGFSLDEIGSLLDSGREATAELLQRRRTELAAAIEADRNRLVAVDARLRLIHDEADGPPRAYVDRALPRLRLMQLTGEVQDAADLERCVGPLFVELTSALGSRGIRPSLPSYAWYDSPGESMRFGVGYSAMTDNPPEPVEVAELPAYAEALTTIHEGPVAGLASAWQALAREVEARGLTASGPGREVYHQVDPSYPDGWVIELQLPTALPSHRVNP